MYIIILFPGITIAVVVKVAAAVVVVLIAIAFPKRNKYITII